jgi:hypothetical protein
MMNHHDRPLIGCRVKAEEMRDEIEKTARTNLTVMIRGERGTGKDMVAREIHLRSNRAGRPFIKVNCASLPEELIETELFGCEKGAYTGAVFRQGKFELAHRGTIFLDEVGELSTKAQPKLLHVTETLVVDRVGLSRVSRQIRQRSRASRTPANGLDWRNSSARSLRSVRKAATDSVFPARIFSHSRPKGRSGVWASQVLTRSRAFCKTAGSRISLREMTRWKARLRSMASW